MKHYEKIMVVAVAFALAAFILPMSAVADTISANITFSFGEGRYYKTSSDSQLQAYEMDVCLSTQDPKLGEFYTYGYDVEFWGPWDDHSYPVELTYLSDFSGSSDTYYKIAWLLDDIAGESGLGDGMWSDDTAVALQSLIWAVLLNGDSSNFKPHAYWEPTARSLYNTYYNALNSITLDQATRDYLEAHYMLAISDSYADFMVRIPEVGDKVPVPATVVLLGTGLMGLAAFRKRNRFFM